MVTKVHTLKNDPFHLFDCCEIVKESIQPEVVQAFYKILKTMFRGDDLIENKQFEPTKEMIMFEVFTTSNIGRINRRVNSHLAKTE